MNDNAQSLLAAGVFMLCTCLGVGGCHYLKQASHAVAIQVLEAEEPTDADE